MQRYPMTPQGHAALEAELKQLKSVDRPRITASIAEAREHGDLKENAEYHAAREQQGFCEARIRDIEAKLGGAQVIDPSTLPKEGRIVFGVSVVIENMDTEEEKQYQINMLSHLHKAKEDRIDNELQKIQDAAINNQNIFEHLMEATKVCSLGQITKALFEVGGQYRRNM